jgi:hypothetical protein
LWSYVGHFSLPLAYRLQNLPANKNLGLVHEEMCQTLLTSKKQEKMRLRDATNIIKPTSLMSIYRKKYFYFNTKTRGGRKKFKKVVSLI